MDKSGIKLRTKPDVIIVDSHLAEKFVPVMGVQEISLKIKLSSPIVSNEVKAKFSDGILMVTAPMSDPPNEVDIDCEDG